MYCGFCIIVLYFLYLTVTKGERVEAHWMPETSSRFHKQLHSQALAK